MLIRAITDIPGEFKEMGSGERNYQTCPICGDSSWHFYVNPATGGWFCFSGAHHRGGFLEAEINSDEIASSVLNKLRAENRRLEWPEIELPEGWHMIDHDTAEYLIERGFDRKWANKFGLCQWGSHIVIPYFDAQGRIIYWAMKILTSKYINAPGQHPLFVTRTVPRKSMIIVVEGQFDAMKVATAGYKGVALGGKSLPKYLRQDLLAEAQTVDEIVVMLDRDAVDAALGIQSWLQFRVNTDVRVVVPSANDPGDMTPEEITEAIK